jgi:hypothetical protein
MHDMIAAPFQFTQQPGQRLGGPGLDVVQQQDTLAVGLDAPERSRINLRGANVGPVVS